MYKDNPYPVFEPLFKVSPDAIHSRALDIAGYIGVFDDLSRFGDIDPHMYAVSVHRVMLIRYPGQFREGFCKDAVSAAVPGAGVKLCMEGGDVNRLFFNSIYAADLPHRAVAVYMYLRNRSGKGKACFPAIGTIAKELSLSRRTVERALGDLGNWLGEASNQVAGTWETIR